MIKLNKIKKSSTFKVHEWIGLWAGHSSFRRTGLYNLKFHSPSCFAIEFGMGTKNTSSGNRLNWPVSRYSLVISLTLLSKEKARGDRLGGGIFSLCQRTAFLISLRRLRYHSASPVLELEMTRLSFPEKREYYFYIVFRRKSCWLRQIRYKTGTESVFCE